MADGNPVKTSSRSPTCPKPSTSARPPSQIRAVSSAPVSPARTSSARQRTVRKLKYVQPAVLGLTPSLAFRTRPPPCPPPEGEGIEPLTVRGLEGIRGSFAGRERRDQVIRPDGAACPAPRRATLEKPAHGDRAGSRRCRGRPRPTDKRHVRARNPASRPLWRSRDRSPPGEHPSDAGD